ncbi:MAG: esterase [Gemmatimonadaceae bacterium]|nr:esterase [Gemmatimonadaceae bacterium]
MSDSSPLRIHTLQTVRTARYAVRGAELSSARRIWFALHGYGQVAPSFLKPFTDVVPADTSVVAAEGLNRFYREMPRPDGSHMQQVGATWMTRENREDDIADTLTWLGRLQAHVLSEAPLGAQTPVGVLAFSQGVAAAIRWIATGTVPVSCLVLWAGGMPHDVDFGVLRQALRNTRIVLVLGIRDPFITESRRAEMEKAIAAIDRPVELMTFDGEHHLDPHVLGTLLEALPHHAS